MKIFIDFDDVLFNTKKFRTDYLNIFKKHGISKKVFEVCYYSAVKSKKNIRQYNPVKHIERLTKLNNINPVALQKDVINFVKDTSKYIFNDVGIFLERFKKRDLIIASFSETDFQKAKIVNSGITKNFHKVEIINELKSRIVGNLIKSEKLLADTDVYFIDDRVEQLADVKQKFPQIKTILLKRKEGRYNDRKNKYCDFVCHNLEQAEKIILKFNGK
jgi:FMN phosphatase YigB (HAD superfamily)